jgi:hypothetical protein
MRAMIQDTIRVYLCLPLSTVQELVRAALAHLRERSLLRFWQSIVSPGRRALRGRKSSRQEETFDQREWIFRHVSFDDSSANLFRAGRELSRTRGETVGSRRGGDCGVAVSR